MREISKGIYEPEKDIDYKEFEVAGAGIVRISTDCNSTCGGKTGFSIGVEWGRFGYTGGVMDKEDAIKLAKFIVRTYNLDKLDL